MKGWRRKHLAHVDNRMSMSAAAPTLPPQPKATPNRKQRRLNAVFNRKIKARLAKDKTPAQVEVLPDGGVHITLKKDELQGEQHDEADDGGSDPVSG